MRYRWVTIICFHAERHHIITYVTYKIMDERNETKSLVELDLLLNHFNCNKRRLISNNNKVLDEDTNRNILEYVN